MENAYLFEFLAGVAFLVAGVRLSFRASGTSGDVPKMWLSPERLLAASFLFVGLSYACYQLPLMLSFQSTIADFAGRILSAIGVFFLLVFIARVFRPEAKWATGLALVMGLAILTAISMSALIGDLDGFNLDNKWFWLEWWGYELTYLWLVIEACIAFLAARKRIAIGLADRMVSNRYLMWSLFGIAAAAANLVSLGMYEAYARTGVWQPQWDGMYGVCELVRVFAMWLVFFPPAFYVRWVLRKS